MVDMSIIIIIIIFIILFIYLNTNNSSDVIKENKISKYLESLKNLEDKNIIDESLIILLKLYNADLSRKPGYIWLEISNFEELDNCHKVLLKLIELNLIKSIDKEKRCYVITYDGVSLIELNNILFLNTRKIKFLSIIRILLNIKLSRKTSITNDAIELYKLVK